MNSLDIYDVNISFITSNTLESQLLDSHFEDKQRIGGNFILKMRESLWEMIRGEPSFLPEIPQETEWFPAWKRTSWIIEPWHSPEKEKKEKKKETSH